MRRLTLDYRLLLWIKFRDGKGPQAGFADLRLVLGSHSLLKLVSRGLLLRQGTREALLTLVDCRADLPGPGKQPGGTNWNAQHGNASGDEIVSEL
jgi:hypothetical protein